MLSLSLFLMFTLFGSMDWPSLSQDTTGFGFPWRMGSVTFQFIQSCNFICGHKPSLADGLCVCVCVYYLQEKGWQGWSALQPAWQNGLWGHGAFGSWDGLKTQKKRSRYLTICHMNYLCCVHFTPKYITWWNNFKPLATIIHHVQCDSESGRISRSGWPK